MDINVKIEAPELSTAINNIAVALAAMANPSGGLNASPEFIEKVEKLNEELRGSDLKKHQISEPLKGSDLKKHQISEEIVALGGTPPEKGSVAKFENVLSALKVDAEVLEETTDEMDDVSLDDVRTLAYAVTKSTPDNPTKGKSALGGCLKSVKAENLTGATQAQLNKIVPMLEEYLGKTLAEVLAEAE